MILLLGQKEVGKLLKYHCEVRREGASREKDEEEGRLGN